MSTIRYSSLGSSVDSNLVREDSEYSSRCSLIPFERVCIFAPGYDLMCDICSIKNLDPPDDGEHQFATYYIAAARASMSVSRKPVQAFLCLF